MRNDALRGLGAGDALLAHQGDDVLRGNRAVTRSTAGGGTTTCTAVHNHRIYIGGGVDVVRAGSGHDFVSVVNDGPRPDQVWSR